MAREIATAEQLDLAHKLADDWHSRDLDLNEAGKLLAYLRATRDWGKCLELADRLAKSGAVRSKRTRGYYGILYATCLHRLGRDASADAALTVLGWAFRLGRYNKVNARGT